LDAKHTLGQLNHKTALVTGAGRGIGAAVARAFIAEGATVFITDIDPGAARSLARELGDHARAVRLDVSREGDWADMEDRLREADGLDVLVNNAGITGFLETPGPHDPEHLDLESWRAVMAVNADGVALGCRTAIRLMKTKGGAIVNLSSRSGVVGVPGAAAYAASKAAVMNHTRTVALYCAQQGYQISCNALLPAAIRTPMWDAMLGEGEARDAMIASIEAGVPMGRFGTAEEVADAAVFLASARAGYMTGAGLHLDGGILAGAQASPKRPG